MPRHPRTHLDRLPLHIVQRGHNRDACFLDEQDCLAYLLATMRNIELNPVRACMVDDPAYYRWSSYRANELGQAEPRITPHPVHTDFARDHSERQAAYRQLFRAQLDDDAVVDIRLALTQSLPLGNSRFHEQIARAVGKRREARPRSTGKGHDDGAQRSLDLLAD